MYVCSHVGVQTAVTPGSPEKSLEYELCAVLLHLDQYNMTVAGHYVALTKDKKGEWYDVIHVFCVVVVFFRYRIYAYICIIFIFFLSC